MTFYFYLARCADGSLYAGSCTNISQREIDHNRGKGAAFTKRRRPVRIIYFEEYPDLKSAMRREKQIKGWRREKKEWLINYQSFAALQRRATSQTTQLHSP